MSTEGQGAPNVPTREQLAVYLKSVGQVPFMPNYSVEGALRAVWEWGYSAGRADAADAITEAAKHTDGEVQHDAYQDAASVAFPAGSTQTKFYQPDEGTSD
jgi:hypothetical protein